MAGASKGVRLGSAKEKNREQIIRDAVPLRVPPEPLPDEYEIPPDQEIGTEPTEEEGVLPAVVPVTMPVVGRWSARHKPSRRLQESIEQGLLLLHSVFNDVEGDTKYRIQRDMEDPIAFAASNNPDYVR